jgi:hypothetical protein
VSERFEAVIQVEGRTATYFEVPLDVRGLFGRARPPVRVTIRSHTYRSTIAAYGGRYLLPLNRANRAAAGVAAGDTVTVEIELDEQPRRVTAPADLQAALDGDAEAAAAFEKLSYTHRREYVDWITEAKRAATRTRRIDKTLEHLREGRPQS